MTLSNGEIVIEVCDEGVGFDKKGYRAPDFYGYEGLTRDQGRGIYLIQQLMDRTLIDSRPNQGTIVHMAKRLGKA
jgi:anti-sigma regulatory factor (Ser/Thr protein kinase)